MAYLLLYLAVTVAGYFLGAQLKKRGVRPSWLGKIQTLVIILLVFLMGSRIGANEQILASLDTIGLISLAYTLIIMAFAVGGFFIVRKAFGFDRYGIRKAGGEERSGQPEAAEEGKQGSGDEGGSCINWLTILIVAFVIIGILAGYLILPGGFMELTGTLLTITLCMLLVLIGMDIGTDGTIAQNFRSAGWRIFVFPLVSIGSMMIGSVVAALILPMGVQDAICVGSGLGWYSLAPAMLAEYSTRISAISFMHNVFREVIGILLIPFVARRVGYIESYSIPGSPCMDVCLPIIERSTSSDVAVYSFINGAVLSAAVPILVSLFMNI